MANDPKYAVIHLSEGSQTWGISLDGTQTQEESPWFQTCCSEEEQLKMAFPWGSIYNLIESDLWSNVVM